MVTEATKQEQAKKDKLGGKELEQFARLVLASSFAPGEAVSEEETASVQSMLFGLAVMRGLHCFIKDVQDDGLQRTAGLYASQSDKFLRQIAWSVGQVVEKEGGTEKEQELHAFLMGHGIVPLPPEPLSVMGELAKKLGLPPEVMDLLSGLDDEKKGQRPPCNDPNCEACRVRRKLEKAASSANYYVRCQTHGKQALTDAWYMEQMLAGNEWRCPVCGEPAELDDSEDES